MSDLARVDAPGLPADWLNAWLAAIGVTVLLPDVRLSWTDELVPHAVFWVPAGWDLARILHDRVAGIDLSRSPIAKEHPEAQLPFGRSVGLDAYRERARLERKAHEGHLAATVTDLGPARDRAGLDHGPFDTPAPGGQTLWTQAQTCLQAIDSAEQVAATLGGPGKRIKANGLGFDCKRGPVGVRRAKLGPWVDPVVEFLVFEALVLFPVRGDGRQVRQRRWTGGQFERGAFEWFTWAAPLDRWGCDALLDDPSHASTSRWRAVPLQIGNPSDPTRAIFSERVA